MLKAVACRVEIYQRDLHMADLAVWLLRHQKGSEIFRGVTAGPILPFGFCSMKQGCDNVLGSTNIDNDLVSCEDYLYFILL